MFLQLLLLALVLGGLYQYVRANRCGLSCQRRLSDGRRAGDHCPCACATCPCSPLEGVYETLVLFSETMYQYCNQAFEWIFKQQEPRLISERERHAHQFSTTSPLTMATFEIVPSGTALPDRQRASWPDIGRTATSRAAETAEGGSDGAPPSGRASVKHTCISRQMDDEQAEKIAALCNKCKAKGVTCMRSCPNAKH